MDYLTAFVYVVPNEGFTMVGLTLHVKFGKHLF